MQVASSPSLGIGVRNKVSTRLLLARHGETDWNQQGRWQGQQNLALNRAGIDQALALSAKLKKERLAAVYSSALRRSVETAQAIAHAHNLNVCRDERLNEIGLGEWEGMPRKEIAAKYPQILQMWESDARSTRPPHGESIAELEKRVLEALQEIARAYPGETVCLIGHKMSNGVIRCHYLGLSLNEALRGVLPQGEYEVIAIPHPRWG